MPITINYLKKKEREKTLTTAPRPKYLGIHLTKEVNDLYTDEIKWRKQNK